MNYQNINDIIVLRTCECGCGQFTNTGVKGPKRFISSHQLKALSKDEIKKNLTIKEVVVLQTCECGCGKITKIQDKIPHRFIDHHNLKVIQEDIYYQEKHSKRMKKLWKNPEFRRNKSISSKEMWKNPEFRKNHNKMMRGYWGDSDFKENFSQKMKDKWKDPNSLYNSDGYKKKFIERIRGNQYSKGKKMGSKNHFWHGGNAPSYGYNWGQQRDMALLKSGGFCELSSEPLVSTIVENGQIKVRCNYETHHKVPVFTATKKYLEFVYPNLAEICERYCAEGYEYFAIFEQSIRHGYKDYIHFNGLVWDDVFSKWLYDWINSEDNLIVLLSNIHQRIEHKPQSKWNDIVDNFLEEIK